MIKHVSFDLWNTILQSNPRFREYRIKYLQHEISKVHRKLNHLPFDQIESAIEEVGEYYNKVSEYSGRAIHPDFMLAALFDKLKAPGMDITFIQSMIKSIFLNDLPTIIDQAELLELLDYLDDSGITSSTLSNTGFIGGDIMEIALEMLHLKDRFKFLVFSDKEGVSKPNQDIFEIMRSRARYNESKILHVGDSRISDGAALGAGMNFHEFVPHGLQSFSSIKERLKVFA